MMFPQTNDGRDQQLQVRAKLTWNEGSPLNSLKPITARLVHNSAGNNSTPIETYQVTILVLFAIPTRFQVQSRVEHYERNHILLD